MTLATITQDDQTPKLMLRLQTRWMFVDRMMLYIRDSNGQSG